MNQIGRLPSVDLEKHENGSAVVIVLLFISLMTLVGVWATRNANTEVTIAGNEVRLKRSFYRAEAALLEAAFLIEAETSDNLRSHATLGWLWNAVNGVPFDLTDFANWDFDGLNGDDTAFATALDLDGDGTPEAEVGLAVHDLGAAGGSSLVMTNASMVRSYAVYGQQNSDEGRVLIEVGYKKRLL